MVQAAHTVLTIKCIMKVMEDKGEIPLTPEQKEMFDKWSNLTPSQKEIIEKIIQEFH